MLKVAIVGSGELTSRQAPFDDESWEIWGIGTNYLWMPRFTKYFELYSRDL